MRPSHKSCGMSRSKDRLCSYTPVVKRHTPNYARIFDVNNPITKQFRIKHNESIYRTPPTCLSIPFEMMIRHLVSV